VGLTGLKTLNRVNDELANWVIEVNLNPTLWTRPLRLLAFLFHCPSIL